MSEQVGHYKSHEEKVRYTYHDAIREQAGVPFPEDETQVKASEQKQENEVIKRTLVVQWHKDGVTQQLFKDIDKQIIELETLAREKACGYHVTQNHLEIISLLVRSAELRKLKETYASIS